MNEFLVFQRERGNEGWRERDRGDSWFFRERERERERESMDHCHRLAGYMDSQRLGTDCRAFGWIMAMDMNTTPGISGVHFETPPAPSP